jgi:hypothetical protein
VQGVSWAARRDRSERRGVWTVERIAAQTPRPWKLNRLGSSRRISCVS